MFSTVFKIILVSAALEGDQGEPKNQIKGKINYDLDEADKLLNERDMAITSPFFENPENFDFGLGKAKSGLMWSGLSVSFETDSAFTLTATKTDKLKKGEAAVDVSGLHWDKEENVYIGEGIFYGRTFAHCPLRRLAAKVKVKVWSGYPFRGAWYSLEGTRLDWKESLKCVRITDVTEKTEMISRTFTNVEVIRAIEQAQNIWSAHIGNVQTHYNILKGRRESAVSAEIAKMKDQPNRIELIDKLRTEQVKPIDDMLEKLRMVSDLIFQLNNAAKFGGRVEWKPSEVDQRFEKGKALERADNMLIELTSAAMRDALALKEIDEQISNAKNAPKNIEEKKK